MKNMPHFVSTRGEMRNMDNITSDSDCLKVSAVGKASRISGSVSQVTIGPDSILDQERSPDAENIENEPNNLNIENTGQPQRPPSPKSPARARMNFSNKKILLENDLQRKDELREVKRRRWQCMEKNDRELRKRMDIIKAEMAEKRMAQERAEAENLAKLEADEERLEQQTEMRRKHEQQLQAQRILEHREKLEKEAEEQRRIKERRDLMEKMVPFQASFRAKCQDISLLSKSCKNRNAAGPALAPHATKLKELNQRMEALVEKARSGDLTESDVNTAEVMVKHSEDILNVFRCEMERINSEYDVEIARREEEVRRAEIEAHAAVAQAQEIHNYHNISEHVQQHLPEQTETNGTVQREETKPYGQAITEYNFQSEANIPNVQEQENVLNAPLELKAAEASNNSASKQPLPAEPDAGDMHEFVDKESLELYLNSQQFLETYSTSYQPILQSDSTKKFRFECKKAINIPVNAISGVSNEHLTDKYEKLHQLLSGRGPVNVNQHPQGIAFCKDMLAAKFVSQGETLVSSKPEMAFSVASVAIALWNEHPDFGDLLIAHFQKSCPYLAPIFLPQQENQSNEDYYKSLGYKSSEDGMLESEDQYLKKISGLVRLYAALMVTRQKRGVTKTHPYGVQNAWRWLSAIMNIEPRPAVCATLIFHMLEVAGNALWIAYPTQFPKMLILLASQYFPRMESIGGSGGGPMARLERFFRDCLTKGTIPPPKGQLPPNFW